MGVDPTGSGLTTENCYSRGSVANEKESDSMLECKMSVSIVQTHKEYKDTDA